MRMCEGQSNGTMSGDCTARKVWPHEGRVAGLSEALM
jgi:hypothetical protein